METERRRTKVIEVPVCERCGVEMRIASDNGLCERCEQARRVAMSGTVERYEPESEEDNG